MVDLPEPLAPTRATVSPGFSVRLKFFKTTLNVKRSPIITRAYFLKKMYLRDLV